MTLPIDPEERSTPRRILQAERAPLSARIAKIAPRQAEWEKQCRSDKAQLAKLPVEIRKVVIVADAASRTEETDARCMADYYTDQQPDLKSVRQKLSELDQQLAALEPPTTLVMAEAFQATFDAHL